MGDRRHIGRPVAIDTGGGGGGIGRSALPPTSTSGGGAADSTQAYLFAEVLTRGPISRTELAHRTNLSQSTVTKVVNPLITMGYLIEVGARRSGVGRPQRLLTVVPDRHAMIGMKIGPRQITAVLTDLSAQVLDSALLPLEPGLSPEAALALAADVIDGLIADDPEVRKRLLGIGVGLGGHIDSRTGRCVHSGVMGWDDVDVAGPLSARTGLPVVVNNDVNSLVIAERWFGGVRDIDSFAVITTGPGVGCGLMLDGELIIGPTGLAGEIGHIPLEATGVPCACGNRGCLETMASDSAVLRMINSTEDTLCPTVTEAIDRARDGDRTALNAFATMGEALGRALATLVNLLNLQRIVLTGERAAAYDLFGPACQASLTAHAFSTAATDCALTVEVADDFLWARGAACLVIREALGASPGGPPEGVPAAHG
jgi:predicted NBD/HSP70 family sugar kinase